MKAIIDAIVNGFTALFNIFKVLWQWQVDTLVKCWLQIFSLPQWAVNAVCWTAAAISTVVVMTADTLTWISEALNQINTWITGGQIQGVSDAGSSYLLQAFSVADRFIPLHELIACFTVFTALWVAMSTIKAIKGTIPGE